MKEQVIRTNCGMCHAGCGILAYVADGKLMKVEGDPDCPANKGTLCPRGLAAVQFVYHPDRLKYPMKRAGQRGEGNWERISWEEALDTIAQRIKEIREKDGPLAVAMCAGTGRPAIIHDHYFLAVLGTPNRSSPSHFCFAPTLVTGVVTYGHYPVMPDLANARCIVNWGSNITHTNTARLGREFISGLKSGAKLITIDPFLTPIASKSDLWLQIRPGTDCALSLAWLNFIISERLYDRDFVEKWTSGFDKLAKHVEQFTPEWAEQVTWVPAQKIKQAARLYATTKPAALFWRVAVEQCINSTNTVRSLYMLPAVTGNIDIPGGTAIWEEPVDRWPFTFGDLKLDFWDDMLDDAPLSRMFVNPGWPSLWRAVLTGKPYPVKGVLMHNSNTLVDGENSRGFVLEALKKVEFLEVMDHFMTPTAEMADIVLPAATCFERDNVHFLSGIDFGARPMVCAAPKVIEPLWESRDDGEAYIGIVKKLGLNYGADSVKERLNQALANIGLTFDEFKEKGYLTAPLKWKKHEQGLLRPDKKPGFNTPSGKVEIYSQHLESLGLDPLPVYKEPPESPVSSPELAQSYPLVLTTGLRSPVFFHSQYRQIPWLREIHSEPIVRIHPETAAAYSIKDGDWVYIESSRGKCKQKTMLTLGIDPRVVLAEHGWWFPEKPAPEHGVWQSNINLLTDSEPHDRGIGSTSTRSLLCRICKAEGV